MSFNQYKAPLHNTNDRLHQIDLLYLTVEKLSKQVPLIFPYSLILMNSSQLDLVKHLVKNGVIENKEVTRVMEAVDRKNYISKNPYFDQPQYLGFGATISAPHMHAYALQHLYQHIKTAKNVLDVGSGTGYLTATMALLAPKNCGVYGIEHVPGLVELSLSNLKGDQPLLLDRISIVEGDGRKGWIKDPSIKFDAIHIGAAADKVPEALLSQLANGGRMILPLGGEEEVQQFVSIDKDLKGTLKKTVLDSVRYVPLTDLKKQLSS